MTIGVVTIGVVTNGIVIIGVVTIGVVSIGVVTIGIVIIGVVTIGVVNIGTRQSGGLPDSSFLLDMPLLPRVVLHVKSSSVTDNDIRPSSWESSMVEHAASIPCQYRRIAQLSVS